MRRSVRASEGETHPGALLTSQPANLSRTYALPASTTAMESNPKNRPRRTAVRDKPIRLATCLDRSAAASGAIASTVPPCLPRGKLLSPAERLALVERPRRRAAHRAGASRRTGLSPPGRPLAEFGRAVEGRQRGSKNRGEASAREAGGRATRSSWKTIGAGLAARLLGAARPARAEARYPWAGSGVLCVKFCKGGHGWLESCGLAELNFLVLFEIVHIEIAVGFEPVLVGLDG